MGIGEPRPLTTDEIRFFLCNGFLKVPWKLRDGLVSELREQIDQDIQDEIEPLSKDRLGDVMRLSAMWQRGGAVQEALGGIEVQSLITSLVGNNASLALNVHNHLTLRKKDDGSAMSLEIHRDVSNWSGTICTILFYLEETTFENGCTQLIPGSHLFPSLTSGLKPEDDPWWINSGLLEQRISIPMSVGSMLVIDSMVLHCAGKNKTNNTRMTLTAGYHAINQRAEHLDPNQVVIVGEHSYRGNDLRSRNLFKNSTQVVEDSTVKKNPL